ncbi:hypothetical protein [Pseudonocardia nigra]|uniref:hypothetical protein n=1 Tax=Pseudonocardia nigra TaxID=1921578 RepID=UPI001C5E63D7|nr:hypothetical protein [Pseudonocardia nigra]
MQPLSCRRCGTSVLVEKNSLAHTLVRWTTATDGCVELTEHAQRVPERALTPTCLQLRDSIETAVRRGELVVPES